MAEDLFHEFEPQDIDEELWDGRREHDKQGFSSNVKNIFGENVVDKLGVSGRELDFDLSLSNSGSVNDYRSVVVLGGEKVNREVLNVLCLELENYVTIVNWISDENEKRMQLYREFSEYVSSKDEKFLRKIKGNYRLSKESFSTVLLYRSESSVSPRDENIPLNWWRVPFLKKSGEDFAYFSSPMFMSNLISDKYNVEEERVNKFCAPFKVISKKNKYIEAHILNNTDRKASKTLIETGKSDNLRIGKIYLGLFEEQIYRKNNKYIRNFFLSEKLEKTDEIELTGHFLLQRLYYNYLKDRSLYVCTKSQIERYLKRCIVKVGSIYKKKINLSYEYFLLEFLEGFFRIIGDEVYYSPYLLREFDNKDFKEFIEYVQREKNDSEKNFVDRVKELADADKYKKYEKLLQFINKYNFYKNRTLIEKHLNSKSSYVFGDKDNPEKWKWIIQ